MTFYWLLLLVDYLAENFNSAAHSESIGYQERTTCFLIEVKKTVSSKLSGHNFLEILTTSQQKH